MSTAGPKSFSTRPVTRPSLSVVTTPVDLASARDTLSTSSVARRRLAVTGNRVAQVRPATLSPFSTTKVRRRRLGLFERMGKPQLLVLPDVRDRRASVLVAVVRQDVVGAEPIRRPAGRRRLTVASRSSVSAAAFRPPRPVPSAVCSERSHPRPFAGSEHDAVHIWSHARAG